MARQLQHGRGVLCQLPGERLDRYRTPEIFNSSRASQFTGNAFTGVLENAGITISMDGRGQALGNIFVERPWRTDKYEGVYLKGYVTIAELTLRFTKVFPLLQRRPATPSAW